ncbi:facilitated trehalose transporter Tret1-like [Battus philenor]|uniref:facilitated trehalose transporter Tret1-like n=1 Tax=Battus philenor TaxID=42288 RepID=UPI0035D05B49
MLSLLKQSGFRQCIIVIIVNLNILTTGMSLSWPSPVLVKLNNETETPLKRPITLEVGSWIVSSGSLSVVFVLMFLSKLMDFIGRKYCLILACIPKILASTIFIFAKDAWQLILGRAIIGTADIFLLTIVPIYASEISDKNIRGSLGTFLQVFSSLGVVITLSVGPFVSYNTFSITFAGLIIATSIPTLFLPDSPYFLYSKGKTDDAIKVLKFLYGSKEQANEEISAYATSMNNKKANILELLKNRIVLKSLIISILFGVLTQLSGFNAVSYYLQTILESTKTNVMPETASVIIGLIQLLASASLTIVTERFKRRHIMIISSCGVLIGMIGLGTFFKIKETTQTITGLINYLPVISLILVVYCYSAGTGALFWVVISELFDGPARSFGVSVAVLVTAFTMFLTTKYFGSFTLAIGPAMTYWSFSIVCAIIILFIYFCIPETKGKTFNEIQKSLGAKN